MTQLLKSSNITRDYVAAQISLHAYVRLCSSWDLNVNVSLYFCIVVRAKPVTTRSLRDQFVSLQSISADHLTGTLGSRGGLKTDRMPRSPSPKFGLARFCVGSPLDICFFEYTNIVSLKCKCSTLINQSGVQRLLPSLGVASISSSPPPISMYMF